MFGEYPTVGCLILLEKAQYTALGSVVQALQSSLSISLQPDPDNAVQSGSALLGGTQHEMMMLAQKVGDVVAVHIEFDEHEVMHTSQQTRLSFEQLFMPYVQAATSVPGVLAGGSFCARRRSQIVVAPADHAPNGTPLLNGGIRRMLPSSAKW